MVDTPSRASGAFPGIGNGVKVLLADDSYYVCKYMKEWLEREGDIQVVETAHDGVEAVRQVMRTQPDLVFLDFRMPKLDGLGTLREIMRSYPTPCILYCEREDTKARNERLKQKAMDLGALEVIFKPASDEILNDNGSLGENLRQRVRVLSKIKVVRLLQRGVDTPGTPILTPPEASIMRDLTAKSHNKAADMVDFAMRSDAISRTYKEKSGNRGIVLIGSSTGGPDALRVVLSRLPADFSLPIVIAQHMPRGFTVEFAQQLSRACALPVKEASETDIIEPGHVYIAPGNHNLEFRGQSGFTITPANEHSSGHLPNIDLMLRSGSARFQDGVVAVILTGMGSDGSAGIQAVKASGGDVITQDEKTSSIYGMPRSAVETGCVDCVAPIQDIAQKIIHYAGLQQYAETK
jgi:two-component system chemotaxis response regulator CheB